MRLGFKRNKGPYREALQVLTEHLSEKEISNLIDRLIYTYKERAREASGRRSSNAHIVPANLRQFPNEDVIADLIHHFAQRKSRKFAYIYEAAMPHIFKGKVRQNWDDNIHSNAINIDDNPVPENFERQLSRSETARDRDLVGLRRSTQRVPRAAINEYSYSDLAASLASQPAREAARASSLTEQFVRSLTSIENRGRSNGAQAQPQYAARAFSASPVRRG